jgi:Contractile injection system tube protein
MALVKARLTNASVANAEPVEVMFNPDLLTVTTNILYPDISVPGLRTPLLQFIRGEARTLAAELFLDQSNTGESLAAKLEELRAFVTIDSELHAPPVCRFEWGDTTFTGVMAEFAEKFQMFDETGRILRARVTVKLKAYEPANQQLAEIDRRSPDRTKTRTVRAGDRYDLIAAEEYGDAAYWRVLAAANGDERPRLLAPGTVISIPPL